MRFPAGMVVILISVRFVAMLIMRVCIMIMVVILARFIAVIFMIVILAVFMVFAVMIHLSGGLSAIAVGGHFGHLNLSGLLDNWRRFGFQCRSGLFGWLTGGKGERTRGEEEDRTRHCRLQLSFDRAKYGDYLAGTI